MTKEKILEIIKQIGLNKGYRISHPEDWYSGINNKELNDNKIRYKQYHKYFKSHNDIIMKLLPNYKFLEWEFKKVSNGFWKNEKNIIKYLKSIGKSGLISAIHDYHGGLLKLKSKLEYI